ncbi:MAG: type II toxin-antitoxin system RelE/ParE family toxin [Acholeplasmatales bacterium]|nr:type II toxin-antitoxin system RelE/ParE family toxin [Acholeplasmatales bacterium]
MKKYDVIVTPYAEEQLEIILHYISEKLLNYQTAIDIIDLINSKKEILSLYPETYPLSDFKLWNKRKIRKINVKSFIMYYYIDKAKLKVYVISIVFMKRDKIEQFELYK